MNDCDLLMRALTEHSVLRYEDIEALFTFLQVPPQPIGIRRVLEVFEDAITEILGTVDYEDEYTLFHYRDLAAQTARAIQDYAGEAAWTVSGVENLRPYYTKYPLYCALERGHRRQSRTREYVWVLGLLTLGRAAALADVTVLKRLSDWAMAARAFGEERSHDEVDDPERLLDAVSSIRRHEENPASALRRMRMRAQGARRREHARYLLVCWRVVSGDRQYRRQRGHRHSTGGFQAVRGAPSGPYATRALESRHAEGLDRAREWAVATRDTDAQEHDGQGRAGEAPGDSGMPGAVQLPAATDSEFAVPHYTRGAMRRALRHRRTQLANQGQDTVLTTTVWTPVETARLLRAVENWTHSASRSRVDVQAGAMVLLGLLTGVDAAALERIVHVSDTRLLPSDGSRFAIVGEDRLAWRPRRPSSALHAAPAEGASLVHAAVPWVVVPRPGWLPLPSIRTLAGQRAESTHDAIDRALRQLSADTGLHLTWDRIRRHWWGWMARTAQPTVATVVTGYVRPATAVPRYYQHLRRMDQDRVYRGAYHALMDAVRPEWQHLGWSWQAEWDGCAETAPGDDEPGHGSPIVPQHQSLCEQMPAYVRAAGADLPPAVARADQYALMLYHCITMAMGVRSVRSRAGQVGLVTWGARVISDKDTDRYSRARYIPLPDALHSAVVRFSARRERCLAGTGLLPRDRLEPPEIARDRAELIEYCRNAPEALLAFAGYEGATRLTTLTPTEIRTAKGLDLPLPTNWPRHWLRSRCTWAGVSDHVINALLGHACIEQDPWGPDSCMRTSAQVQDALRLIEGWISQVLVLMEREVRR